MIFMNRKIKQGIAILVVMILISEFLCFTDIFTIKANANEGLLAINEENFPDEVFRNYIAETYDKDSDNYLSSVEIENINYIRINDDYARERSLCASLKGIEHFYNLQVLYCKLCSLNDLDLRYNTKLQYLDCSYNYLSELDITNNVNLINLLCKHNSIKRLNTYHNPKLNLLDCEENSISKLDLRNNTELTILKCYDNLIVDLDLRKNEKLGSLTCGGGNFVNGVKNRNLQTLNVKKLSKLQYLKCSYAKIEKLDLSDNVDLITLECTENNNLKSLDLSKNLKLKELNLSNTLIKSLDILNNTLLEKLNCEGTQSFSSGKFEILDISGCPNLVNMVENHGPSYTGGSVYRYEYGNFSLRYDRITQLVYTGLSYPIYTDDAYAEMLKTWINNSKYKEYFDECQYSTSELIKKTIDSPAYLGGDTGYLIKNDMTIGHIMAYLVFAEQAQRYSENALKDFVEIAKTTNQYSFFGYKTENDNLGAAFIKYSKFFDSFGMQYYNFISQSAFSGNQDTFKRGLFNLQMAQLALKIADETDLKKIKFLTKMYYVDVEETYLNFDGSNDFKNYLLSGGDVSLLSSDVYNESLEKSGRIMDVLIQDGKMLLLKKTDPSNNETELIDICLDALFAYVDINKGSGYQNAEEVSKCSKMIFDVISGIKKIKNTYSFLESLCTVTGAVTTELKVFNNMILKPMEDLYSNFKREAIGFYCLSYYYLGKNNPGQLDSMIISKDSNSTDCYRIGAGRDKDTFNSSFFNFHLDDPIEEYISRAYGKYLEDWIYEPGMDGSDKLSELKTRDKLWNISKALVDIDSIDCNKCKDEILIYLLACLSHEMGEDGVAVEVNVASCDDSLGRVIGINENGYTFGEKAVFEAVPLENVTFLWWKNKDTNRIISIDYKYEVEVTQPINIEAVFQAGEIDTAELPIIDKQPQSNTYYAGQVADALTINVRSVDNGVVSVDWYENSIQSCSGGDLVGHGNSYVPRTDVEGTKYYYAVVSNRLTYSIGTTENESVATIVSNCVDITVTEPIVLNIEMVSVPTKTDYFVNDEIDISGMEIAAILSNGERRNVNTYFLDYDFSNPGNKEVVAETPYGDLTFNCIVQYETHIISFDSNGGMGNMQDVNCIIGTEYSLPTCNFAMNGKLFDAWVDDEEQEIFDQKIIVTEDTVVKAKWKDVPDDTVVIRSASLTLEGQIGLNVGIQIPDAIVNSTDAKVEFIYKGVSKKIAISSGKKKDNNVYEFTYLIPAKAIANKIGIRIIGENGEPFKMVTSKGNELDADKFEYAVTDYCAVNINDKVNALTQALQNYGSYAQAYFNSNDVHAELKGDVDMSEITMESLADYRPTKEGTVEGISFRTMYLTLESETQITLKYELEDSAAIGEYEFYCDNGIGRLSPIKVDNNFYEVTIPNIVAKNLDKKYTITVSKGEESMDISCYALSYVRAILNPVNCELENYEKLCDAMRALYLYNKAANEYFEQ